MKTITLKDLPLEKIFREGKAMFYSKYGCMPEEAYISPVIKRAIIKIMRMLNRLPSCPVQLEYEGLPLFHLKSPYAEIHLTKVRTNTDGKQERMVQRMKVSLGFQSPVAEPPVVLQNYEYDSQEELEWLNAEKEIKETPLIEVPGRVLQ